jgi:two-component system nitrate/nitrite response regulator NarL
MLYDWMAALEMEDDMRMTPEAIERSAGPAVHVFIISNIRLFREGLTLLLSRNPSLSVVGSAAADEVDSFGERGADIVLLDATLEDLPGCVRRVREAQDGVKVVAVALGEVDQELITCAEAGISAFVERDGSHQDLLRTIDQVRRGETSVSPHQAMLLLGRIAELAGRSKLTPGPYNLTRREREIVPLIERGLSNREIARHLSIEIATIKHHVHNILAKMQLRRRGEIAASARTLQASPGRLSQRL